MITTYPAAMIAKLCDISLARVGQLAKEGVIKKLENGQYSIDAVTAYIKWIRENQKKTGYGEKIDEEKHRKLKRENDTEERLVAPLMELQQALEKVSGIIDEKMVEIPVTLVRKWPGIFTADVVMEVDRVIALARNAIADIRIDD